MLKAELAKYQPEFQEDLDKTLIDEKHQFMKVNFPLMYNLENYYLHIKLNQKRRQSKLASLVFEKNLKQINLEKVEEEVLPGLELNTENKEEKIDDIKQEEEQPDIDLKITINKKDIDTYNFIDPYQLICLKVWDHTKLDQRESKLTK